MMSDSNAVPEGSPNKERKNEKIMRNVCRRGKVQTCRNDYWELSSETPRAILAVTSCNDLVACQINKFRSFSSLVSPFPWRIQNVLLNPVFWKMSFWKKKKRNRNEWFKKQSPRGWHHSSDGNLKQFPTDAMEMTCVPKIRLGTMTCFTYAEFACKVWSSWVVETWSNLPVSLWRKVSQFHWKSAKKNTQKKPKRMSGGDLISADMGKERWNAVQNLVCQERVIDVD